MSSARVCDLMLLVLSREFDVSTGEAAAVVVAAFACSFFSLLTALAPTFGLLAFALAGMGATAVGIVPMAMAWICDQVWMSAPGQETTLVFLPSRLG